MLRTLARVKTTPATRSVHDDQVCLVVRDNRKKKRADENRVSQRVRM
jgi:hypothetical protein